MSFQSVAQHPASVEHYIRHGWSLVPVPSGTKGPQHPGWNKRENALKSQQQLPPGWGIGLAHAYSGTMALDIDNWDAASFELMIHGIDLHALYSAPDAVIVDSGRAGRGKLLYAMPFGLVLPTKKVIRNSATLYELRCGTSNGLTSQDVLPPSIHPTTNQPYRWAGNGHWTRLPAIPTSLLTLWHSMLQTSAPQADSAAPTPEQWQEIESALAHISPDCSRGEWINVGMALHDAGQAGNCDAHAFTTWDEWSKPSDKYPGEREMAQQWHSFRSDKATKVRLATLFKMARDAGWSGLVPNVAEMFSTVGEMTSPAQITLSLRTPPPQLDLDLVPAPLRRYAMNIANGVGCDPMMPIMAGLAAVSGAMDARTRLELKPGFEVPPVIWILCIGEPAGKKSHGASPMFKILHQLQAEDKPRFAQEMQKHEAREARYEVERKAFLDAAKDPEALLSGELPHGYGEAPKAPVPLKILTNDTTSQKLVRQAADHPRGLIAHMDEMLKWAENVTDKNSGENRSAWTQAYEAAWYEMDRVGAGTITCDNFAISIYGNLQPAGFETVMQGMAKDGMLQRFIPVMVQAELSRKGNPDRDTSDREVYEMMVRTVFGLPALTYTLSPEAFRVYDAFQDWYYEKIKEERLLQSGPIFMTAFGKMEGMVGRIALLWHAMTNPYSITVSGETMLKAVEVIRTYIVPSMRYIYEDETSSFDQWIGKHLIQHADKETIKLSEIRRSARRQIEKLSEWTQVDKILSSMYVMEQARWVIRIDGGEKKDYAEWAINPNLKEQFKDHRLSVIAAKKRRMEETYKLSPHSRPKVHGEELLGDDKAA